MFHCACDHLPPSSPILSPELYNFRFSVLSANASSKNTPYLVQIFHLALGVIHVSSFSKIENDNRLSDRNIPEIVFIILLLWSKVVSGSLGPILAPTDLSL